MILKDPWVIEHSGQTIIPLLRYFPPLLGLGIAILGWRWENGKNMAPL